MYFFAFQKVRTVNQHEEDTLYHTTISSLLTLKLSLGNKVLGLALIWLYDCSKNMQAIFHTALAI